ncbi:Flowering time control protein FPA [Sesamum alatum]|uniref:Flowering time control protein FPA n=1 Tax=Sesamum alatum TaxID=300844 RepID=A0AAE1YAS3_9LAMI|nr:Flowering time control protein FPA [Sesamum alatum]
MGYHHDPSHGMWRGFIAKNRSPICHAQFVGIGEWNDTHIGDHLSSYTEFLSYLVAKDRVGVAKLDDGTMLFLGLPLNFLTKFLNVSTPVRLHGVVLKFPQPASRSRSMSALPIHPQYGRSILVPLSDLVNVNAVSRSLPSEVDCKYQNQQFQTALNGKTNKTSEIDAQKNEQHRATLLFAANLLSRVHQEHGNSPEHGT